MDFCLVSKETRQIVGEANSSIFAVDWKHLDFKSKNKNIRHAINLCLLHRCVPLRWLIKHWVALDVLALVHVCVLPVRDCISSLRWNQQESQRAVYWERMENQSETKGNGTETLWELSRKTWEDWKTLLSLCIAMKGTNKDNIKNASQVLKQHESTI